MSKSVGSTRSPYAILWWPLGYKLQQIKRSVLLLCQPPQDLSPQSPPRLEARPEGFIGVHPVR
ncbi:MAG: hypothetical protein WBW16_13205 [Bacteroidota bacterium]